ncbi:hypothetical protein [Enterobacter sp. PGRG2]|uniref:hypothetical protein n=1 Tax=Enterobacter sp. PGRG2 TaxID=3104013 RepID=UPI002ABDC6A1|nr:hypothetical protein [Enterobacter sp. PGRG2]WJD47926.1 hypothetical protein QRD42_11475 [Enterobacter sp. PGRG2]
MDNSRQAISPAAQQIPGFRRDGNNKKFLSLNFAWNKVCRRVKAWRFGDQTVPLMHLFRLPRTHSVQDFLRQSQRAVNSRLFVHPAPKNTTFVGGGKSFATSRLQSQRQQPPATGEARCYVYAQ